LFLSSTLQVGKERASQEAEGDAMLRFLKAKHWPTVIFLAICLSASSSANAQTKSDKDANLTDQEKLQRILQRVGQQQRAKTPDADNKIQRTSYAADRIAEMNHQLDANRQLQRSQSRNFNGILNDVDRSALTAGNEITYPKDWNERTRARSLAQPRMTAKERSILRTLDSSISVDFKNRSLQNVLDYLRDKTGLPIVVDQDSLKQVDAAYDSPVSVSMKDVSVRTVLHQTLGSLGLTYIIRNEAIQVVSPALAKQAMVVRTYYAQDLIPSGLGFFTAVQAAQLIEMIQSTVAPGSWKANGGDGTILYDPITGGLVVKQSAEFQSILAGSGR
jgi:hypothetical protein